MLSAPATPDYTGFVLNATVTETTGSGFLTVSPDSNTLADYQDGTYAMAGPALRLHPELDQGRNGAEPGPGQRRRQRHRRLLEHRLRQHCPVVDVFGFYMND